MKLGLRSLEQHARPAQSTAVAKAVGETRPPGIAKYSAETSRACRVSSQSWVIHEAEQLAGPAQAQQQSKSWLLKLGLLGKPQHACSCRSASRGLLMAWHCYELEARSEASAASDVDLHDFKLEVSETLAGASEGFTSKN